MKNINLIINKNMIITAILLLIAVIILVLFLIVAFPKTKVDVKNDIDEESLISEEDITDYSLFPEKVNGIPVYTEILDDENIARTKIKRKIKYIVIHETDNVREGADAKKHSEFLKYSNTISTGWHYTVDNEKIYHHIPDNEVAYHAASRVGNWFGIGIELCVNEDSDFEKTFYNAVILVAYLIKEYNLDINCIKTHHDFSGKDCPHIILNNNRLDEFKNKVYELITDNK